MRGSRRAWARAQRFSGEGREAERKGNHAGIAAALRQVYREGEAGIIAAAQRVEHYEIAAYGCAINFARLLGHHDIVTLLEETLAEEKAADEKLSAIAEEEVNQNAVAAGTAAHGKY